MFEIECKWRYYVDLLVYKGIEKFDIAMKILRNSEKDKRLLWIKISNWSWNTISVPKYFVKEMSSVKDNQTENTPNFYSSRLETQFQ